MFYKVFLLLFDGCYTVWFVLVWSGLVWSGLVGLFQQFSKIN